MLLRYRAAGCVSALDLATVFCAPAREIALKIGAAFLEEGQYLYERQGETRYRRAAEGDLRALKSNPKDYQSACARYCVPFLYVGMPVEL